MHFTDIYGVHMEDAKVQVNCGKCDLRLVNTLSSAISGGFNFCISTWYYCMQHCYLTVTCNWSALFAVQF